MYRKIMEELITWKNSSYRKPLILQGARQTGKTYTMLELGREHYENVAYFNFESDVALSKTFDENIKPDSLIPILSHICKQSIIKEKTLIIFDEIQLCERALTSLKYFCEEAPEYHVIAAGSLLSVAVDKTQFSFPVGKVDIKTMYPLDFKEFLLALNESDLVDKIQHCFNSNTPMPDVLHKEAMDLYRKYLVIGGMPEIVSKYIETNDYLLVRHLQSMLLISYLNDMSKYNTNNEIKKTRQVYDSITVQLSRRNTQFQYKLMKKGGRASEFENAIEWLNLSGIVNRIYRAEKIMKPLENYRDSDAFKIYVSDVGLLCAKKGILAEDILYMNDELNDFMSGLKENYVCNQLTFNGYTSYYWESERSAEIDFIIQREGEIIPIEVKAAENTKAKSLKVYMNKYKPSYAIKITGKNFGFENNQKTIPLYATFCI